MQVLWGYFIISELIVMIQGKEAQYCKHLLALKLAILMNKVKTETVADDRVRLLLEELA